MQLIALIDWFPSPALLFQIRSASHTCENINLLCKKAPLSIGSKNTVYIGQGDERDERALQAEETAGAMAQAAGRWEVHMGWRAGCGITVAVSSVARGAGGAQAVEVLVMLAEGIWTLSLPDEMRSHLRV